MNDKRDEATLEESRVAEILAILQQEHDTALIDAILKEDKAKIEQILATFAETAHKPQLEAILEEMRRKTEQMLATLAGDYSIIYLETRPKEVAE